MRERGLCNVSTIVYVAVLWGAMLDCFIMTTLPFNRIKPAFSPLSYSLSTATTSGQGGRWRARLA